MKFLLPNLPYDYNALEPYYSEEMLRIHYGKHHQAYTNKLNIAVESAKISDTDIEYLLKNLDTIDEKYRVAIRNNGGGYYNHTFFWNSLTSAQNSDLKNGSLLKEIEKTFGSFETFKANFTAVASTHFGSGWAWLVLTPQGELKIIDTHDQISPISLGHTPLLTIDVWEHAYYLQYKNVRPDWIQSFWNIVNWEEVSLRYQEAK